MSSFETDKYSEIDLPALARILRERRRFILVSTFACAVLGSGYSLFAQEWYRAATIVTPAERSGLQLSAGGLQNLASLAGVDLTTSSDGQRNVAVLRSRELVSRFVRENELESVLLDGRRVKSSLKADPSYLQLLAATRIFDEDVRTVTEDKRNGTVTVGIRWKDPEVAAEWANGLVALANRDIREIALSDAKANIEYLRKELATSEVPALQHSIGGLLENEMHRFLLARGKQDFAFAVADPARPPLRRSWPKRPAIVIAASLAGFVLSVLITLALHTYQGQSPRS